MPWQTVCLACGRILVVTSSRSTACRTRDTHLYDAHAVLPFSRGAVVEVRFVEEVLA